MLRSLLETVPGVLAPAEICNANSSGIRSDPSSYLRFRAQACAANADYFYPVMGTQLQLLDEYMAYLGRTLPDATWIVLDVKYSHVHNFNGAWWDFVSPPFLLEYARKRTIPVIHLVRENVYQTGISNIYAQKSGVWSARHAEDVPRTVIKIPRRLLERRVARLVRTIHQFEEWLSEYRHLRINYESLVASPAEVVMQIGAHLGFRGETLPTSAFVRTTPPYEEAVENFEELKHLVGITLREIKHDQREPRTRRRRRARG